MSPLELMQLPIKWPLCSGQTHWFTVGFGSKAEIHWPR